MLRLRGLDRVEADRRAPHVHADPRRRILRVAVLRARCATGPPARTARSMPSSAKIARLVAARPMTTSAFGLAFSASSLAVMIAGRIAHPDDLDVGLAFSKAVLVGLESGRSRAPCTRSAGSSALRRRTQRTAALRREQAAEGANTNAMGLLLSGTQSVGAAGQTAICRLTPRPDGGDGDDAAAQPARAMCRVSDASARPVYAAAILRVNDFLQIVDNLHHARLIATC